MSSADSLTLFVFDGPSLTRRLAEFCFAALDAIFSIERLWEIACIQHNFRGQDLPASICEILASETHDCPAVACNFPRKFSARPQTAGAVGAAHQRTARRSRKSRRPGTRARSRRTGADVNSEFSCGSEAPRFPWAEKALGRKKLPEFVSLTKASPHGTLIRHIWKAHKERTL